jgi:hypothetical protein
MRNRNFIMIPVILSALALAACGGTGGTPPVTQVVELPTQSAATNLPPPTATVAVPNTPVPTMDFRSYLLTQAYSMYTPDATSTLPPAPTATATFVPGTGGVIANPTTVPSPAPITSVYINEPVLLPNAVTEVTCEIRNIGDCVPTMPKGTSTYFNWKFGVSYGEAAISIERNGQSLRWFLTSDGLKPPPEDEDDSVILLNGENAEFRAGLDNLDTGSYTAHLYICPLTPAECLAGNGWQKVGGQSVQFTIAN